MWGSETVARLTQDELDMRCGPPGLRRLHAAREPDPQLGCVIRCSDGRMLYANYGKACCAGSPRPTRARWINGTPSFGRYQDFVSTDLYWFTDPNERNKWAERWLPEGEGAQMNRSQVERASNYGYQIDYLRKLDAMDGQASADLELRRGRLPMVRVWRGSGLHQAR